MTLFIEGVVRGIKREENMNRTTGEMIEKYKVGFESPKPNGYDGEVIIKDVQISKSQLSQGLAAHYEKIVGQKVRAPVWVQPWKNGNAYSLFFSDDGKPVGVKN